MKIEVIKVAPTYKLELSSDEYETVKRALGLALAVYDLSPANLPSILMGKVRNADRPRLSDLRYSFIAQTPPGV